MTAVSQYRCFLVCNTIVCTCTDIILKRIITKICTCRRNDSGRGIRKKTHHLKLKGLVVVVLSATCLH